MSWPCFITNRFKALLLSNPSNRTLFHHIYRPRSWFGPASTPNCASLPPAQTFRRSMASISSYGFPAAVRDPPERLADLVAQLDAMTEGPSKRRKMRRVEYKFAPTGEAIYSYSVPFEDAYKKEGKLPTKARGLFVRKPQNVAPGIVARGYDKFFNIGETKATQWTNLAEATKAPYEMTLKENGCIIFVAAFDGHLVVTSKHALGQPHEEGQPYTHAQKGEQWLDIHLERSKKTRKELATFLAEHNVTAVFELTDDDFEEHVLEYPPERRGLHLHGINYNTIEFKTWPADAIHRFSELFGFVKVGVVLKNSLDEVRALADACADTGSYEHRPIEGFVVRCNTVDSTEGGFENFFFKVKFDEPYLMYREWREVTKQLLKERQPFKNYRYELTYKYVEFVRRKMKESPELFAEFLQNKGIIHVRNLFLDDAGITNPERYAHILTAEGMKEDAEAAATANGDSDKGDEEEAKPVKTSKVLRGSTKTLLVPIACIGSGKTSLGIVLSELYGFGHVQNDDITAKKNPGDHFNKAILEQFHQGKEVVFADRNNHKSILRSTLSQAIRTELPGCKIIALNWDVDPKNLQKILDVTVKRVLDRGENHQSLTPGRTENFRSVMASFIKQRDPLNLDAPADKLIDDVVDLAVENSVQENVFAVVKALGLPPPDPVRLEEAVNKALEYKPTVIKEIKAGGKGLAKAPRYFGIRFDVTLQDIMAYHCFGNAKHEDRAFFDQLVANKRIPDLHHVTLVFIGDLGKKISKLKDPDNFSSLPPGDQTKAKLCRYYSKAMQDNRFPTSSTGSEFPSDTLSTDVVVERVIWNDRIMCLPVSELALEAENVHPHVTVGTASDEVKNVESNALLQAIAKGEAKDYHELRFPPLTIRGHLEAFYN